ncbi:Mur ligase [Pilobolus umbonatus]|nr:Mur ligase [Pilobolus umbonatus]
MDFGLNRINSLLDILDRPDERLKIIHVAGTNGKGSVCAYISSVLLECGYRVGRFNSPHLVEPRDSININSEAISQTQYDEAVDYVSKLNRTHNIKATSFEQLVAVALDVFDKANMEFAVLEVGLGGLMDATNAIRHPVMTVITTIGLDHANILGNTLTEIAKAKGGIMKTRCPAVISSQEESNVLKVLTDHATLLQAPYKLSYPAQSNGQLYKVSMDDGSIYEYSVQLLGDYQRINSSTAITALDWMSRLHLIEMNNKQLIEGMKKTKWPGRLEWIKLNQEKYGLDCLLADGAHNPQAASALRDYIDSLSPKRVIWIMASTLGKDIDAMIRQLLHANDILLAVPFTQPIGMPWITCIDPVDIIHHSKTECYAYPTLYEAITKAGQMATEGDRVVLCGSLYLVADLYRLLNTTD